MPTARWILSDLQVDGRCFFNGFRYQRRLRELYCISSWIQSDRTGTLPRTNCRRGLKVSWPLLQAEARVDHSKYHVAGRAAVYNFPADNKQFCAISPEFVTDPTRLWHLLVSANAQGLKATSKELIILEGLRPELVAVIGELWQIPPVLLKRHEFTGLWTTDKNMANYVAIPSAIDPSHTFSFNYWDMIYFDDELPSESLRSAENHRNILTTTIGKSRDRTGIVSRKASYWGRERANGGWQALIIVDSAVDHVIVGKGPQAKIMKLGYQPFQGGYHDPATYESLEHAVATSAPPRTSTLDDLVHYFRHHASELDFTRPASMTHFLKLIAYSNMNKVFHYTRGLFDQLEYQLDQRQNFAVQNPEKMLQPFWSDLHHFRWRSEYFVRNLTNTVLQLGIDEYQISPLDIKDPVDKNFLFLQRQLRQLDERSAGILAGYGVLSQIASSQQGLLETKAAQNLQYLAVIFLPLSFGASLFSMQNKYNLGQEKFWAYVVTAVILLNLAVWGYWLSRSDHQALLWGWRQRFKKPQSRTKPQQVQLEPDVELPRISRRMLRD